MFTTDCVLTFNKCYEISKDRSPRSWSRLVSNLVCWAVKLKSKSVLEHLFTALDELGLAFSQLFVVMITNFITKLIN